MPLMRLDRYGVVVRQVIQLVETLQAVGEYFMFSEGVAVD
jgi:hypothetical protein